MCDYDLSTSEQQLESCRIGRVSGSWEWLIFGVDPYNENQAFEVQPPE